MLLHRFFKVIPCISCPLPSRAKLTLDPDLLKLLLRTKGVAWDKVLNALGQLCLLQCFFLKIFPKKYGGYNIYISTSVQKEYD